MQTDNKIIFISTEGRSRLYYHRYDHTFELSQSEADNCHTWTNYHAYQLSDEPLQQGDWKYCFFTGEITQYDKEANIEGTGKCEECRKIIFSTDKSLNLPLIPDDVIKKAVENANKKMNRK